MSSAPSPFGQKPSCDLRNPKVLRKLLSQLKYLAKKSSRSPEFSEDGTVKIFLKKREKEKINKKYDPPNSLDQTMSNPLSKQMTPKGYQQLVQKLCELRSDPPSPGVLIQNSIDTQNSLYMQNGLNLYNVLNEEQSGLPNSLDEGQD